MTDSPVSLTSSTGPPDRRWLRRAIAGFYAVTAVFVLIAIVSSVDRTNGREVPTLPALTLALICVLISLRLTASGWSRLLSGFAPRSDLIHSVYGSQLGKYVPGGVAQAAGQVAIAARAGVPTGNAVTAYLVYATHVILGSLAVASLLLTQWSEVGWGWAALGGAGILSVLLIRRDAAARVLQLAARLVHRLRKLGTVPPQPALTRCFSSQVAFALGQGLAFALLLRSLVPTAPLPAAIGAHALAFGLGLIAVPVPSGLLVREGVLVAVLHSIAPPGTVVTAAVFQRLVGLAAEVLTLVGSHVNRRLIDRPGSRGVA